MLRKTQNLTPKLILRKIQNLTPPFLRGVGGVSFVTFFLIIISACNYQSISIIAPQKPASQLNFEQKIDYTFQLAKYKLFQTVNYLEKDKKNKYSYPSFTQNNALNNNQKSPILDGFYHRDSSKFWAAGYFPALLWKMSELESDLKLKNFWHQKAIYWSQPLRKQAESDFKDMVSTNLFVFKPWYENSVGKEKEQQLLTIFKGAKSLSNPLDLTTKQGFFAEDIGVIGYFRKADRTDNLTHWHAFMDHTINVEQLLWAAQNNQDGQQAKAWETVAITHLKTLANTMDKYRKPGKDGTWQRGYFEINPKSPNYGNFLFNEGKQGWRDDSTWSRGQAWWIYATSVAYQYTQDSEILAIAKKAINYYLNNLPDRFPLELRIKNDFIPPWDFDYAKSVNPKTEKDSSAAAIAIDGILKLVKVLPPEDEDRQRYLKDAITTLEQLMSSEYLATVDNSMSILLQGCYHHFESITPTPAYDNGLIWGDYFFIDALQTYQSINLK